MNTIFANHSAAEEKNKELSTPMIVLILFVLGLSYMVNAMDRQVFPAVLGSISKEYDLTLASGGFLSTSFALNIAIFGALSGWFMSRFGRRATLIGGLLGFSLFTALTPFAQSFLGLAAYRSLTGAGEALHIGAIFACMGAYFGKRRGMAIGVINSFFGVGAYVGPVVGTLMLAHWGSWRYPFYAFAALGVFAAMLVLVVVPRSFLESKDTEGVSQREGEVSPPLCRILNRNLVLCALAFSMVGYCLFSYISLYATYLRTVLNFTPVSAGATFGMYGIGALGAFAGGWLSDKWGMKGLFGALAALVATGFAMFHGPTSPLFQSLASVAFGLLISGYLYPRLLAMLQRNVHPAHVGYSMAIAIPMFYLPGLLAGFAFGRLVPGYGWSMASLASIVLPAVTAIVLMCFYKPAHARGD